MGEPIRDAMDLAVNEVNADSNRVGDTTWEIVYQDSQGDPTFGVSATQRLIDVDQISIISTFLTGVSEAVKVITEQSGALLLAQTVSPTIVQGTGSVVRMHYSFVREGELLRDHILEVGSEPVGFIRSSDPSTSYEVEQVIKPGLVAAGMESIVDEIFDVGNRDFRSQVARLQAAGVQQVCLLGYGSDFPNLLRDLATSGLLDSAHVSGNLGFIELPAETPVEYTEGVVFTSPPFLIGDEKSERVRRFEEAYRAKYGSEVPSYSAYYAYDAVILLKEAVDIAGSPDPQAVFGALSTNTFDLMTGEYMFENGDSHPPAILAQWVDGALVRYAPGPEGQD